MDYVTKTLELLQQHTTGKPSADALLIACQLSQLTDAVQRVGTMLSNIDDGIDEANSLNEQRSNRGW